MNRFRTLLLLSLALCCLGCKGDSGPGEDQSAPSPTILTYNVLASEKLDERRTAAQMQIIEESQADIICLQEVLPVFIKKLKAEPWFRENYRAPMRRGRDVVTNGNYICSRYEVERFEKVYHKGPRGRVSLIVHVLVEGRPMAIATCHLESPLRAGPTRAKQLDDVFSRLGPVGDVVFAGDFNFGDGEQPDTAHLAPGYIDLWSSLRPKEPGFTWDIETNRMAARGSFVGEGSRRLDRILVRSEHWRPRSVRIVGNQTLSTEGSAIFPSDHFGLLGVLSPKR